MDTSSQSCDTAMQRCVGGGRTGQDRLHTGAIAITDAIVRQENKIAFKPIQETIHKTMFTMQGWRVPKSGHQRKDPYGFIALGSEGSQRGMPTLGDHVTLVTNQLTEGSPWCARTCLSWRSSNPLW